MKNLLSQKLTSFSQLFIVIPLLFGVILTLGILLFAPLVPSVTSLMNPDLLQADVYPEFHRPDGNLPEGNIESEFLPAIINIFLALVSTVVLGVLLTAGALFIIHFGDEEKLKTAKGLLKYAIIGIIIIVVAYALVQGVTQLQFERT